jgi:hypothetical protein
LCCVPQMSLCGEEIIMTERGTEKLLSLLFEEGRELVNFRFFPGENVSSPDELCQVSHDALREGLAGEEDQIPSIQGKPVHFGDLVSNI